MSFEKIDDSNYELYAAKHYENPDCVGVLEFQDDLKRFKYLRRLFNRYMNKEDLQSRLIINHLLILRNLFGDYPAARMLFFKVDPLHYSYLKTFLNFLGFKIDYVHGIGINGEDVDFRDIPTDHKIDELLRDGYKETA